ncbi:transposase domain-containing protein [Streptomyces sp. NBC_01320]|uniref:transposase domain-containing protein n=1 Tax=Streptomyces sp. NBC_01320 TaxID=2903824 RepID=UPI003FA3A0D7
MSPQRDLWRARCGESRTAGSGSGLGKRAGLTTGTAPQADFHLCLFSSSDSAGPPGCRAVLRTLTEKLRHLPGGAVQCLPTSSALTRARQRLGAKPLQALFERQLGHVRWRGVSTATR